MKTLKAARKAFENDADSQLKRNIDKEYLANKRH